MRGTPRRRVTIPDRFAPSCSLTLTLSLALTLSLLLSHARTLTLSHSHTLILALAHIRIVHTCRGRPSVTNKRGVLNARAGGVQAEASAGEARSVDGWDARSVDWDWDHQEDPPPQERAHSPLIASKHRASPGKDQRTQRPTKEQQRTQREPPRMAGGRSVDRDRGQEYPPQDQQLQRTRRPAISGLFVAENAVQQYAEPPLTAGGPRGGQSVVVWVEGLQVVAETLNPEP